jgi:hypothetical protein
MNLQFPRNHVAAVLVVLAAAGLSNAQVRRRAPVSARVPSISASHVAAEVTQGKISPVESKPGDTLIVKLQSDVKANGQVVLRKGTTITGVVRNVKQLGDELAKAESKNPARSMVQVEWLAPVANGKAAPTVSIALQSLTQINSNSGEQNADELPSHVATPVSNRNAGALSNGLLARPVSGVVGIASTTTADAIGSASAGASGQSNRALLSMPSVVAVDHETSSIIESETGSASTGQLFNIGHGRVIAANGALQSVTFYSHFNNDTVITSQGKNFEISAGAQMQMLVGVNKK